MENNKYYTPSIDEFYVGFQYEILNKDSWEQRTISDSETLSYFMFGLQQSTLDSVVRCKFLDKSDIESCGFKVDTSEIYEEKYYMSYVANDSLVYNLIFDPKNTEFPIQITSTFLSRFRDHLFKGTIKNISELRKLLKQIGIEDTLTKLN